MSAALESGATVAGRYRIERVIGKGGFGVVYRATHVQLGRSVALKVLLPNYSDNDELVLRFIQEARSAAAIGHPGIVEVFDLGQDEGRAFLAMEMLDGEELAERITREHPLSEATVAHIGAQIADAIAAAHDHGIVHRDLKPENVFLTRRGRSEVVKILDFGIAKLLHAAGGNITKTGQLFGTPRYMAPEQFRGAAELDHRADIYAIGTILFQALTNQLPFDADSYPELVLKIMADRPPAIARFRPDISADLIAIIERAMAKAKEDRWQSAHDLADALEAHAARAPSTAPPPSACALTSADTLDTVPATPTPTGQGSIAQRSSRGAKAAVGGALVLCATLAAIGGWVVSGEGGDVAPVARIEGVESDGSPEPGAHADEPTKLVASNASPEPNAPPHEPTLAASAPSIPSAPEVRAHRVRFITEPRGARVSVDGVFMCTAPCEATLHELPGLATAEREGYEPAERRIEREDVEVAFSLVRRERRRGTPRRPAPVDTPPGPAPPPLRPR